MNKNQFINTWIYGSQEEKNRLIKELAQKNIWANDETYNISLSVKERVMEHILKCNPTWAFTLWIETTHIYLNSDLTVRLGVYGLHLGDIVFPKVSGIVYNSTKNFDILEDK